MKITISGTPYEIKFLPFAQPEITPAIKWSKDSAGFWRGSDRGFQQDVYRSKVSFQASDSDLDAIQNELNSPDGLDVFTLSDFDAAGQDLFGPEIDYGGTLEVVWDKEYQPRRHVLTGKVSALDIMLRLASVPAPTLETSLDNKLNNLHLQSGWDGDTAPGRVPIYAYDQSVNFVDNTQAVGEFNGVYLQKPAEAREILAYLLTVARANPITPADLPLPDYPFGVHRGNGPFYCVARQWDLTRVDLNRWQFKIKFCEFQNTQTIQG